MFALAECGKIVLIAQKGTPVRKKNGSSLNNTILNYRVGGVYSDNLYSETIINDPLVMVMVSCLYLVTYK